VISELIGFSFSLATGHLREGGGSSNMAKAIAIFLGDNGETADLQQPGKIIIYQKNQGMWQEQREKKFALGQARSARELRAGIAEVVEYLGNTKIIVGRSITGLPYFELEKAGCCVWEITGKPQGFLEYVLIKDEEMARTPAPETAPTPVPEDLGNGYYRLSIKEIQERDTGITSKQALQPILRQGNFFPLEVICSHIPPWLETDIMMGNLACTSEQLGFGEVRIVIRKKGTGD
jgi:Fe-only nitrogenase accessory protein AnfO